MDCSRAQGRLTRLQCELLRAFFTRESSFFLTGGAVLAGWTIRHRETHDLDLFATGRPDYERGWGVLADAAADVGAAIETLQTAPDFRRCIVRRANEAVLVDMVFDRTPQVRGEKPVVDGVRMDPVEEIVANKICAVVGRAEIRDLVDLLFLERAGWRIEGHLADAARKDGGVTPAALAWVLSGIRLGDDARLPAGVPVDELRRFLDDVQRRLRALALPKPPA
jgi:hypothetical protein